MFCKQRKIEKHFSCRYPLFGVNADGERQLWQPFIDVFEKSPNTPLNKESVKERCSFAAEAA